MRNLITIAFILISFAVSAQHISIFGDCQGSSNKFSFSRRGEKMEVTETIPYTSKCGTFAVIEVSDSSDYTLDYVELKDNEQLIYVTSRGTQMPLEPSDLPMAFSPEFGDVKFIIRIKRTN